MNEDSDERVRERRRKAKKRDAKENTRLTTGAGSKNKSKDKSKDTVVICSGTTAAAPVVVLDHLFLYGLCRLVEHLNNWWNAFFFAFKKVHLVTR